MTVNNIKTVLFAFLIAVMILPFSVVNTQAQEVPGGKDITGKIGPVGNIDGRYIDLLTQQEEFLNMTEQEKQIYLQRANEFINSDAPYEKERNKLLERLSSLVLDIKSTEDEMHLKTLNAEYVLVLDELKEFGVVPYDPENNNIEEIANNYFAKKKELENTSEIRAIHTDNVSLENRVGAFFPCAPGVGFYPTRCFFGDTEYGPSTVQTSFYVLTNGPITFTSQVCLVNPISHNLIYFDQEYEENVWNIFGTNYHNREGSIDRYPLYGFSSQCMISSNNVDSNAPDRFKMSATLGSRVIVSGSHA